MRTLRFGLTALVIWCLYPTYASAHSEQDAPAFVEIVPQRTFLTVRISGNGGDLADLIHADAHGISAAQASAISEQSRQQAREYFGRHLMLKQNGVRLKGELRELRLWQSDALDSSRTRFEVTLRYARDPKLASAPLRVTSGLFDYLQKSRAIVSMRGEEHLLKAGETGVFSATNSLPTATQNAGDWAVNGVSHIAFGWDHLLFTLALFLAASHLCLRAVALALGAFTVAHGVTFCLAVTGVLAPAAALVGVGIAASILVMGGHDFWLSRVARKRAAENRGTDSRKEDASTPAAHSSIAMRLALLTFACGLIHGFASVPALLERGLPEAGLALCMAAFLCGTVFAQIALGVVTWRTLQALRERFEHGAQYGGMDWPRATQLASLAVMAVGGFWMIERLMN